jgi:hypothetical protein
MLGVELGKRELPKRGLGSGLGTFKDMLFKIEERLACRVKAESGVFANDNAGLDFVASKTRGCGRLDLDDVIVGHGISCYRQQPVSRKQM